MFDDESYPSDRSPKRRGSVVASGGRGAPTIHTDEEFSDGVRGYLFQGRFGSCVLDERHLLAAARYVELNPVKGGMVREAGDYPWSSARFHLGINTRDSLVRDKNLMGLIEDWAEYLRGNDEPSIQTTLLRGIRTGRPAGSEQFIEMIERLTGRDLMMRKAGRPHKRAS